MVGLEFLRILRVELAEPVVQRRRRDAELPGNMGTRLVALSSSGDDLAPEVVGIPNHVDQSSRGSGTSSDSRKYV